MSLGSLRFVGISAFLDHFKHLLPSGKTEKKSRVRLREFGMAINAGAGVLLDNEKLPKTQARSSWERLHTLPSHSLPQKGGAVHPKHCASGQRTFPATHICVLLM